jgi:predicted CopG family antitoxin
MVKTITIRNEVYKKLVTVKKKNESFSELFERLTENSDQTEILKRIRARVEFTKKDEMLNEIYSSRAEKR